MRKTFLGVLVFMSQLIFAQGIEVTVQSPYTRRARSISPEDKSEGGLRSSNQRRHERSEKI